MTTHAETNSPKSFPARMPKHVIGGAVLITIGLLLLVGQIINAEWFGLLVPAGLGLVFLLWGIVAREFGPLVPGGIMAGIGAGLILNRWVLVEPNGETQGAVILLSFGAGWGLITVLSALFTHKTQSWPLIPGAILAAIGGALLAGEAGQQMLEFVGQAWPLALIAAGLYVIFRRRGA